MKKFTSKFVGKVIALSMSLVVCLSATGCGPAPAGDNQVEIWTAYSSEKILQDLDYSHRYGSGKTVSIDVFKNEYEAAQLMFTPSLDVASYSVTTSDLTLVGNDSVVLPKEDIAVYHQMYMPVTAIKDANTLTGKGMYPEALMPMQNAIASKINKVYGGENQGVWIEACPAEDQPAGLYKGNWTLTIDSKNYTIPVEVNVYDYTLSDEKHSTSLFFSPWKDIVIAEQNSTAALQESYADFLYEHRIDVGQLPGNNTTIYNEGPALEKFIEEAKMVANDPRVSRYSFPYSHMDIYAVKTTLDADKNLVLTDDRVTCSAKDYTKIILERIAEASLESNGVYNLLEKMQTYYVYFDEYTSSDKLGEAQYTNIVTPIWYAEVANHMTITIARERGYDSVLSAEEKELLNEYFTIIDKDRTSSKSHNEGYGWESWMYGQFLLSLKYKSTDITPYDGMTGREYRRELYRYAEYSRDYGKKDYVGNITTYDGYEYEFRPVEQIDMLEGAINKLLAQFTEFEQDVLDDTKNMKNLTVGEFTENLDFKTVYCPTQPDFGVKSTQQQYLEHAAFWYPEEEQEVWSYTAIEPRDPNPSYHMEGALITSRLYGWMMYDYGMEGVLYWHILLNRNYQKGELEYVQDYYTNPIRYGGGRGANGEGFILYPGKAYDVKWKGSDGVGEDMICPVASIRLKSIRDGLEEYDIMYAIDEFAKNRAEVLGVEYDKTAFDNLLEFIVQDNYKADKCILGSDYTDYGYVLRFHEIRTILANIIELVANTGVTLDQFAIQGGSVKLKLSAPSDVAVLVGGAVPQNKTIVTGSDGVEYAVYDASFTFNTNSATYFDVKVANSNYGFSIKLGEGYKEYTADTLTVSNDFGLEIFDIQDAGLSQAKVLNANGVQVNMSYEDGVSPVVYVNLSGMNVTADDKTFIITLSVDDAAADTVNISVMAKRKMTGQFVDLIVPSMSVKKGAGQVQITCNIKNPIHSIFIEVDNTAVITVSQFVALR